MNSKTAKKVQRGEIYCYDFGTNEGSIQNGARPVLVVQADDFNKHSPTTVIAALTTAVKKTYLPSHIFLGMEHGLSNPTMVMLEQLRTVNQSELFNYIGVIDDQKIMNRINAGLKKTFGIWFYNANRQRDVRCLCPKCLAELKLKKDIIISRADPFTRIKDRCDKCDGYGYDYVVDKK